MVEILFIAMVVITGCLIFSTKTESRTTKLKRVLKDVDEEEIELLIKILEKELNNRNK